MINELAQAREELVRLQLQLADRERQLMATQQENVILRMKIEDMQRHIYGRRSEKSRPPAAGAQLELFPDEDSGDEAAPATTEPVRAAGRKSAAPRARKEPEEPKRVDQTVTIPDPDAKLITCPVTGEVMRPIRVDRRRVLVRIPALFLWVEFCRNIFPAPDGSGEIRSDWPAEILSRSPIHASIIAYLASQHYVEHQPLNRIQAHLSRQGVWLPKSTMVAHLQRLDELLEPVNTLQLKRILASGYVHVDATPLDVLDPKRAGKARESTLWALADRSGNVAFLYRRTKSPKEIAEIFAGYDGILQHDGAPGLEGLGKPGAARHLGCWAHMRRYFEKAATSGDKTAKLWIARIATVFRVEAICRRHPGGMARLGRLRERFSMPVWRQIKETAASSGTKTDPASRLGKAWTYVLGHAAELEACLTTPGSCIDNNMAERSIRPLKVGAKNWLFIGHPSAGERKANLFGILENCRVRGIDPEAWLIDTIRQIATGTADIEKLLPSLWQKPSP